MAGRRVDFAVVKIQQMLTDKQREIHQYLIRNQQQYGSRGEFSCRMKIIARQLHKVNYAHNILSDLGLWKLI